MDGWQLHLRSGNKEMLTRGVMLAVINAGSASLDKKQKCHAKVQDRKEHMQGIAWYG